jgi:predicted metalloendopeptidase
VNVDSPEFIKAVNTLLTTHSLDDWKTYLSWHTVHAFAPILPRAFVQENFAFYGKTLSGTKELQPRWRRCVNMVDSYLGEALGRKFVEKTFPPDAKQRMIEMVGAIEAALRKDIHALDWMSADTKKQALAKLEVIANKIGYPEKWIDYSTVAVNRADAFQNVVAGEQFAKKRTLTKIGKRVDPLEWQMTPPTVNAYYSPEENNINFPAGILQPPFFDTRLDRAVNYGAIGSVIGHEITHGFDDSGRRFDAKGNLHDWWTAQDAKAFEERAECFVKQYAGYAAVPGANLNGRLTLGENTADNGGVRIAYMALLDTLTGKAKELIDGYTAEQRFFLGFAQVWCSNSTEQEERLRVKVDPHSPGRFRVNGVVSNMPEFRQAFGCTAGQPMVREQSCRVW